MMNYNSILMEYPKIVNLLDNTPNQSTKFRTKNWNEINDESGGTYNTNTQTIFKNSMLGSSLCDCSNVYILVKSVIAVENTAAADEDTNNTNKKVIFKNCAPFITFIAG